MSCAKKPIKTLFQSASMWVGFKLLWISPEYPKMWSNQCWNHESPRNLLEFDHRYYFHQWIAQSLLQSDHKKRSIAVRQQNLRSIGSLFSSHSECKAVHSGTVETRKRLGRDVQSVTSTRMEHDLWEPDSIVLSAVTQIYWRRRKKRFCFTYATAKAYSAAVYLYSSVNGKATVNLVFSKARVAPAKQLSIPRLELLGVLIGTRCLKYVTQPVQLSVLDRFLWTDSQCVLHWMKTCQPLPVYVQNRLREITSRRTSSPTMCPLHKIPLIWLPEVFQQMNLSTITCGGMAHRG